MNLRLCRVLAGSVYVNQVGSQQRIGLVGNLNIIRFENALKHFVEVGFFSLFVVIIYYNIFLPLLLILLSDNLVLLSPSLPSYYLSALPY